jgi:hypothetical protein
MAVTARFQADFSGFLAAIDKAELALVDMSKGASKVESSLNRMVDNFSGRKLIQEASLMTIALEKSGGIATLTSKELEQVGNKANEAADKMKRLGLEVPAGLQKLADATRGASTAGVSLSNAFSVASSVLASFGVTLSIGAVVAFGKELFAAADALTKLHDKTGVSIEGLQKFQVAGDDAGNTLEEITAAIVKMEDKLVGGDQSALGALRKLGLSFDDLKRLSPERQFIAISDALRQVQSPAEQVNIAIDLFGKTGATVLPTLKRGFDDLADSAHGMSAETVRALDEAGDAFTRYWRIAKNIAAEAAAGALTAITDPAQFGAMRRALEGATEAAEQAAPKFGALAVPGLPANLHAIEEALTGNIRELNLSAIAAAKLNDELEVLRDQAEIMASLTAFRTEADKRQNEILRAQTKAINDVILADLTRKQADEAFLETQLKVALAQDAANARLAQVPPLAAASSAAINNLTLSYWAAVDAAAALSGIPSIGHRPGEPGSGIHENPHGSPIITGGGFSNGGLHPLRDSGGPVSAGRSYLIGRNRQPELFTPGANGFITPLGGGATVTNHFYVNGSADEVARTIAEKVLRTVMQAKKLGSA